MTETTQLFLSDADVASLTAEFNKNLKRLQSPEIAGLAAKAANVFGSRDNAIGWLLRRNMFVPELETPLNHALKGPAQSGEIIDMLGRIEAGVSL